MFLVSTYTSAKSWTSKPPLHSAVVAEEWCQAKSSSTSKISDCVFPVSHLPNLLSKYFFICLLKMLNLVHYRMSFFLSCILGTLHFFFININLIIRLPPLFGRGLEWFGFKKKYPIWGLKNSLNNFVTDCYNFHAYSVNYVILKHFASFDPVWSCFQCTKKGTVPCIVVCEGVGWFWAGGIRGVEACQKICL